MDYCYWTLVSTLISVLGTLVGAGLGAFGGWKLSMLTLEEEKKNSYLINARNVILILTKQINEFENIKNHFNSFKKNNDSWYLAVKPLIISNTHWRVSKKEVLLLGHYKYDKIENKSLYDMLFDLILCDKKFNDLLCSIDDFKRLRAPLPKVINKDSQKKESKEIKNLVDDIYHRIDNINLIDIVNNISFFLHKKFPKERFPLSIHSKLS